MLPFCFVLSAGCDHRRVFRVLFLSQNMMFSENKLWRSQLIRIALPAPG